MKSYGELEKLGAIYDLLKNICGKHAWISEKQIAITLGAFSDRDD